MGLVVQLEVNVKLLMLGLLALGLLFGVGALAGVWLARWLAGRVAKGLSVDELDTGLAIPMRDSDTRRRPRPPAA